jgi:hypothetical protein
MRTSLVLICSLLLIAPQESFSGDLPDADLTGISTQLKELASESLNLVSVTQVNNQIAVEGEAQSKQQVTDLLKTIKEKNFGYSYIQKLTPQQSGQFAFHFVIAISLEKPETFNQKSTLSALLDVVNAEKVNARIPPAPYPHPQKDSVLLDGQSYKVFRIFADGKIEKVLPPPKKSGLKEWQGVNNVLIAPNQQLIAYTQDNDLWVYDIQKMISRRLTTIGQPFTDQFVSIEVIAKRWSFDGTRIMYEVAEGLYGNPEGDLPDLETRPGPYGRYIYDLKTSSSREFPEYIPVDQMIAWLANDDVILGYPLCNGNAPDIYKGKAVRFSHFDMKEAKPLSGPYIGFQMLQYDMSGSGEAFVFVNSVCKKHKNELLEFNFQTGKVSAITEEGGWSEFQWPKYSPDGTKISYMHYQQISTPKNNVELMVDGKEVYSFRGHGRQFWINDKTLGLTESASISGPLRITIIDLQTNKVRFSGEWKQ